MVLVHATLLLCAVQVVVCIIGRLVHTLLYISNNFVLMLASSRVVRLLGYSFVFHRLVQRLPCRLLDQFTKGFVDIIGLHSAPVTRLRIRQCHGGVALLATLNGAKCFA